MYKISWAILCLDSSLDQDSKNVSLFKLIDQINLPKEEAEFPLTLGRPMQLVFQTSTDKDSPIKEVTFRVDLIGPGENIIKGDVVKVEFPDGKHKSRTFMNLQGVTVFGEGKHTFEIIDISEGESNQKKVAEVEFEIILK